MSVVKLLGFKRLSLLGGALVLTACTAPNSGVDPQTGFLKELPEAITELANPNQDLSAVILKPEDGCYWYRYDGPIETTMLPLRTRAGNPICTRPQEG